MRWEDKVVQDAIFGLLTAAHVLAANKSYFEHKSIDWNTINMKI